MSKDNEDTPKTSTKRRPTSDLNHDNWDEEGEPEEKGEFKKANEEQLKERKIITARRKQKPADQPSSSGPFGALNLASAKNENTTKSVTPSVPLFNFGNAVTTTPQVPQFDFSSISSSTAYSSSGGGTATERMSSPTSESVSTKSVSESGDSTSSGSKDESSVSSTTLNSGGSQQTTSSKRRSQSDLNQGNWDEEDEPEDQGEFQRASEEQLKDRKIATAKRKNPSQVTTPQQSSPFAGLTLTPQQSTPTPQQAQVSNNNPFSGISLENASAQSENNASLLSFNFSTSQASAAVPKFDFGNVSSSSDTGTNENNSSPTKNSSELKSKISSSGISDDSGSVDPEDNSATST